MKRRDEVIGGRGEAVSSLMNNSGPLSGPLNHSGGPGLGGGGPGGAGAVTGTPGGAYVRGAPAGVTATQISSRPGQPTTPVAAAASVASGAPVPGIVPVPATTSGQIIGAQGTTILDHFNQNISNQQVFSGYGGGKLEMHTGVQMHAGIPAAYSTNMVQGPPPQGGVGPSMVQTAAAAVAAAAAGSTQGSGQFQRLKVEDALSYLDQVKLRFGKQPQVYNDFLDIMKEFKSQSIDTPGVIARVSQLFRGHPELIVGFNTFLPPGYKIEVSVSVPGQQTTVVHTPQGVHHHITSTHPPPPPQPQLTVKPQHHTQQRGGSAMVSGGVTHAGSGVGPHSVHGVGSIPVSVNQVGGGGPPIGPPSGPPAGTVGGNTGLAGQQQHSTNTAPQHPTRGEPQPPPPPPPHHPQLHPPPHHQPPAQPVEFNHAINYVNKIKLRFQGQPDIYKQFLEILHTYQKEQRHIKDGGQVPQRTLTETEVYEKVAKLFENQEDLLQEFGQFLPDATNNSAAMSDFMDHYRSHHVNSFPQSTKSVSNDHGGMKKTSLKGNNCNASGGNNLVGGTGGHSGSSNNTNKTSPMYGPQLKRPHSGPAPAGHVNVAHPAPPVKKPKLNYLKDMSAAEAGKYATLAEYAFFDQVRKALRHEETYHNFLRCITLYNEEIISRSELVQLVHPFLIKFPDLLKWFKDFVGFRDPSMGGTDIIPSSVTKQERISGDMAMEIDYTTCKRLGASYCALPKSYPQPKCSGRNSLCREVLNDTWVSFPSWSEDSTFVTSRKTQYEEYIYRCEDERFELDVVLETNLATMRVLEGVHKKLQRMSPEEAARFRLDDCLGGTSPTIHQRAIKRIYGDKASDIIDGLKKNPVVAVPLVLRRLKAKDEEWREAQKGFNKIWREQNEKYYLKSLDHQGITFKQTDVKTIRSKSLLNDIETLFDERHEQQEEVGEVIAGPHLVLHYKDGSTLEDAANLIIHHVKRQTTVHKDDKHKIKQLVRHFVPDLFFHNRQEMSDDECGIDDEEEDDDDTKSNESKSESAGRSLRERDVKQEKQELNKQNQQQTSSTETTTATTTTTTTTSSSNNCNNSSSKRKTRNRTNENEKESDGKNGKDSNGNNNNNKTKEGSKNKSTLNGDATEDEKINIKTEPEEEKVQIKQEPDSNGNGNVESDDEYRLFMCNNNWYLFLRLHQILCSRLHFMYEQAVKIAAEEAKDRKDRKESTAVALRLKPKNEIAVDDYYPALLDMVKNVLDGNLESTAYEDTLREMFGIHAFNGFTLDKVVTGAVRQLQHLVCDEPPAQCTTMFIQELRKGGGGGPLRSAHTRLTAEQAYQKRSEKHLQDENCFKIYAYKKDCRMTVELIDTEIEDDALDNENGQTTIVPTHTSISPAISEVERWSEYVEKYVSAVEPQMSPAMQAQLSRKPVFLPRNLRSWRKLASRQSSLEGDKNSNIEEVKPPVLCSDLSLVDNTQCKFNLSSFKRVFIVNSDSCMYKKQALKRAKQSHEAVSHRMHSGLASWHSEWCTRHISEADQRAATDWFMGNIDGLKPHHTRLVRIDNPSKSPYTMYNKYKCEIIENST